MFMNSYVTNKVIFLATEQNLFTITTSATVTQSCRPDPSCSHAASATLIKHPPFFESF